MNGELSIAALSARAITGRMPPELVEEGIDLLDVWAEREPHGTYAIRPVVDVAFSETSECWANDLPKIDSASVEWSVGQQQETYENPEAISQWSRRAQVAIDVYATQVRREVYERLTERLQILLDPDEWDVGETMPSWRSFLAMLRFLQNNPEFDTPFVSLLSTGHFELSWRAGPDRLVVLEFRSDGMIDWLVFAPAQRGSPQGERAAGTSPFDLVLDRIKAFDVLNWVSDVHKAP